MELLERDNFLQLLHSSFQRTTSGEGHCVFVMGEAGIGKSSLVRQFLKELDNKCDVLMALCDSLFTPRPLGVLYDLAPQMDPAFAGMIGTTVERIELFAQLLHTVTSNNKPVVMVIEDIHWADEASLDFIKYFARRINHTSCLFILTYRDDEIGLQHPLRNVLGELPAGHFSHLSLTALSKHAVETLARAKGYSGEDVYTITGGNPFYVTEFLANYHTEIPESIRDAVLVLYNRCSDETLQIWQVLAIMPEGFEIELVQQLDASWSTSLELCISQKLVILRGNRLLFKHELFRRTVESFLSPIRRIEISRKVLDLFQEYFLQENMLERVVHYARNGAQNDIVLQYAPLAAKQAARVGSHIEAAKLYMAAIEYSNGIDDRRLVQLYEAYSYECYLTNHIKEAIVYQTKALNIWQALADQKQAGNSERFLSRLWWYDGHRKKAECYAIKAIQTFENLPASKAKAMAYSNLSQLCMLAEDVKGSTDWGAKAINMATEIGDDEIRCHALNNVGSVRLKVPGLKEEGAKLLEESLQIGLRNSFHEHVARAYTNFICACVSTRDYAMAKYYLQEAMEYCGPRDLHSWLWYIQSYNARILLETGEWDEALSLADSLYSPLQPGISRLSALMVKATISIRRGKEDAGPLLNEAKTLAFLLDEHLRVVPVAIACLEYEWLTGERVMTGAELDNAVAMTKNAANMYLNSEADFWLRKVRNIDMGLPELFEPYQYLRDGDIAHAATRWKEIGCPYEAAFALMDGDDDEKREALVILQSLGADAACQKLKNEMRSSGIRKIPRGVRASTLANPAQLTTRELDILQLLKTGASNKEIAANLFISPKTVDHHISSILFKLDVSSRIKAVGEAEKMGILK